MTVRMSKESDGKLLKKWLMVPEVLRWFPMDTEREVDDSIRIWMNYIKQDAAYTIEESGKPIGMAVLYLQPLKRLKHQTLFAIVIDPNYRGKGYGTMLCKAVEQEAREKHGITNLHLEVYEGNPAEKLYKRLGFVEYGRHPGFLKEMSGEYINKIMMEKNGRSQ